MQLRDELHAPTRMQPAKSSGKRPKRARRARLFEDPLQHLWAVSYCDFLMVLLSFFIIFFQAADPKSPSPLDQILLRVTEKADPIAGAARAPSSTVPTSAGPGSVAAEPMIPKLTRKLNEAGIGSVAVVDPHGAIVINFSDNLYRPGEYALTPSARASLERVLETMKPFAETLQLTFVGHTDAQPVRRAENRMIDSNLVLSNLRATRAVEFALVQGFPPERVLAQGNAQFSRNTRSISLRVTEREAR